MSQTSRLSIVVDTSNAKQRLSDFTKQLNDVTKAATNMAEKVEKSLSSKGSQGASSQISGLTRETNLLGTAAQQAALMQDKLATSTAKRTTQEANAAKATSNASKAENQRRVSIIGVTTAQTNQIAKEFAAESAMNKTIATAHGAAKAGNLYAISQQQLGAATAKATADISIQSDRVAKSGQTVQQAMQKTTQEVNKTTSSYMKLQTQQQGILLSEGRVAAQHHRTGQAATNEAKSLVTLRIENERLNRALISTQREEAKLQADLLRTNALMERQAAAAARAAAGLNGMGNAADRANHASRGLHGTMSKMYTLLNSGLVAVTGLGFIKTAAEMQNLSNQIRLVTKDEREYAAVKQQVIGIANKNYNSIAATTSLYQKSARALGNLGKTQQEALQFTNAISTAMRVGGRSAGEQAAALLQLGQAMGAGVIMGDEFRSISENAPILLSLVAKRMGVMQGELKKMSAEGLITAEIMYDAVVENEKMLEDIAKGMPITMGQAFVLVKNKYTETVDTMMNKTGGFSDKLSGLMVGVTKNFETIVNTIKVAGVLAFVSFAGSVNVATRSMAALNFVMGLNPLVRIALLVIGVASAFYGLDDVMETTSIVFSDLMSLIGTGLSGIMEMTGDAVDYMSGKFQEGANNGDTAYQGFFDNTEKGFLGFIQGTSRTIAAASAVIVSFWQWLGNGMWDIVKGVSNAFIWLFNGVKSIFSSMGEVLNDALNDVMGRYDKVVGKANSVLDFVKSPLKFKVVGEIEWRDPKYKDTPYLTINDRSMQSFIPKNLDFFMPLVNEKYFENTGQQINNRRNPADLSGDIGTGLIDPNSPAGMAAAKAREAAAKAEKEAAKEKNKGKGSKPDSNQIMVYKAWKNAGLSENQARIITAEVGRENDYASKYLFGGHTDPKNKKLNLGMISWQDSREKDLRKYLNDMGLIKGNSIEKSQRGLDAQAQFAVQEMLTNKRFQRTKEQFLSNPDIGYNEGTEVLGNNYIAWAYKNQKYANGHARRDKHYNKLNLELGNPDVSKDLIAENKAIEELYKERQEFIQQFESTPQRILREADEKIGTIGRLFSGDDLTKYEGMVKASAQRELAIYNKTLDDKVSASEAYRLTEREKIEKNRDDVMFQAITDEDLIRPENKEKQQRIFDAIDAQYAYDLDKNQLVTDQKLSEIWDFNKTDKELFEDGWSFKIREASLMNDEMSEDRLDALGIQYGKERELFLLNEKKKRLELNSYKMSDTESMVAGIALEREGIALSNATPEQKREQSYAAGQPIRDALEGMLNGFDNSGTAEGNAYLAVDAQYEENIEKIKAYEQEIGMVEAQAKEERLAAEREFYRAKSALMVNDAENIMSSLSSIAKDTMGEQSSIFRAMFAMEKGFAIARSVMNIQVALSSAAASLPFPANLGAITTVAAEGASIISSLMAVAGTGFEKGGYTGSMGTKDIAGVVHGQEYVFDAQSTKRIGVDNLNAMRSGKAVGGGDVNINVNVDAKGNAQVSGDNERMGRDMANGIKAVVLDVIRKEKRQGGMLYA